MIVQAFSGFFRQIAPNFPEKVDDSSIARIPTSEQAHLEPALIITIESFGRRNSPTRIACRRVRRSQGD